MKKILTLCVAVLLAATTVTARNYKHSVGLVGGLGIGAQYKTMVMDDFTIIAELGYFTCTSNAGYAGVPIANLVLAYQTPTLAEGEGIKLSVYAGGQFKTGYVLGNAGIIGFGAAAGLEANMKNAPIAFSFDFRPGYGCVLMGGGPGGWDFDPITGDIVPVPGGGVMANHMFDYSFNLGVRYTF